MPATHVDPALTNGHDTRANLPPVAGKKGKAKRGMDSNEASRLLQARISQLEQDAAGEKDQELEIGMHAMAAPCRSTVSEDGLSNLDSRTRSKARESRSHAASLENGRHAKD